MKHLLRGRWIPAALVGVLVVAVAGGGYAVAASGNKTITVCVKKNGGALYKAKKCKKHDSKLNWNQQGPAGAKGASGANGAPGAAGPAGAPGAPGTDGFQQIGGFGGDIGTIAPSGDNFVFAGPTTQVTTNATQGLTASGSAALGASNPVPSADVGICKQLTSGGAITILSSDQDLFQVVDITTNTLSYGISQTAQPGAGTWNIGMCVDDTSTTQALDKNDFSEGYAFVTASAAPAPAAVPVKGGAKAARAH